MPNPTTASSVTTCGPGELQSPVSSHPEVLTLRTLSEGWTSWKHPKNGDAYTIALKQAGALSSVEFQACFDLIEQTSGDDYRASAKGWNPSQKKDEMRSPELRYVLVKDQENLVRGFTSLMPTWEEGLPVVYCYEIHLQDELHG